MGILFVVQSCLKSLLEDGNDVGTICSRYEFKRALNFFDKLVATMDCLFLHINLVGDDDTGDVGALVSHLTVPSA